MESLAKTRTYLETLASTGKREDLAVFGIAYLNRSTIQIAATLDGKVRRSSNLGLKAKWISSRPR